MLLYNGTKIQEIDTLRILFITEVRETKKTLFWTMVWQENAASDESVKKHKEIFTANLI